MSRQARSLVRKLQLHRSFHFDQITIEQEWFVLPTPDCFDYGWNERIGAANLLHLEDISVLVNPQSQDDCSFRLPHFWRKCWFDTIQETGLHYFG